MLTGPSKLEQDKEGYLVFLEFGQNDELFCPKGFLSISGGHGPQGGMWGSNFCFECGAILDILRNAKKASKKAALYKRGGGGGSFKMSHVGMMRAKVFKSKIPLGTGEKEEFMVMLRI